METGKAAIEKKKKKKEKRTHRWRGGRKKERNVVKEGAGDMWHYGNTKHKGKDRRGD